MAPPPTLDLRSLDRALLARQHLLTRVQRPVAGVIEELVGLQAQTPIDPYVGLWSRLAPFDPLELSALLESRAAARAPLQRCTIHLATADDLAMLRPLLDPVMERMFRSGSPFGRRLPDVDMTPVLAVASAAMDERPRTRAELRSLLGERWPDRDADAMATAVSILAPVVQVPPRGLWGRAGQATWARMEHWLGRSLETTPSIDRLVLRYLAAFGPASPADATAWSGLTRLGPIFERLRPGLKTFRSPAGRELFDLPDAPRPDPDTPAPVRFLPQYDNVLLAHADRSRIVTDAVRGAVVPDTWVGPVLIDGMVGATWRLLPHQDPAVIEVVPWAPLDPAATAGLEMEGVALARFLRPESTIHQVTVRARAERP